MGVGTGRGQGQGSQSWPHCLADGPAGHGPATALSGRAPPAFCDNFIQLLSSWGHKYSGNRLPRGKTAALFWRAPGLLSPPGSLGVPAELPSQPGGTGLVPPAPPAAALPIKLQPCRRAEPCPAPRPGTGHPAWRWSSWDAVSAPLDG